jgi:hypothetical protein
MALARAVTDGRAVDGENGWAWNMPDGPLFPLIR